MTQEPFRILLVDDDPFILKLYGSKLVAVGFSMFYAHNWDETRDMLKRMKPDLIIMDIVMPGMNGVECLESLKQNPETREIPLLFLSSVEDRPEDKRVVKELGGLGILNKSMDLTEFIDKIKEVLAGLGKKL